MSTEIKAMTEKKIEDYLHLYLGCEIVFEASNYYFVHNFGIHKGDVNILTASLLHCIKFHSEDLVYKIRLRPLSDMTEEEIVECAKISNCLPIGWELQQNHSVNKLDHPNEGIQVLVADKYAFRITVSGQIYFYNYNNPNAAIYAPKTPEVIMYLLSKHFDLFGLIESGLAIDKTKRTVK